MIPERRILWTVTDPRGLSISLADDVWVAHVTDHPDIEPYLDQVQLTVQEPDEIYFDPVSTERRTTGARVYHYVKGGILRERFRLHLLLTVVKVVIEPDQVARGYVQSVTIRKQVPKRVILEWKR